MGNSQAGYEHLYREVCAERQELREELERVKAERDGWHGRALDAEEHKRVKQARLDTALSALREIAAMQSWSAMQIRARAAIAEIEGEA